MTPDPTPYSNVKQAVPFLAVLDMERSLAFYVDGLGCEMTKNWRVDGAIRWCWLQLGDAALMLQQFTAEGDHARTFPGPLGLGVTTCFVCEDAIDFYREVKDRGVEASTPFVGNGMWVTTLKDPDGYRLDFESVTDVAEDTRYEESGDGAG